VERRFTRGRARQTADPDSASESGGVDTPPLPP
jgi:hypothetical protein